MNLVERTVQFQQLCYISCSVLGFSITERQNLDLVIHYSSDDVALSAVDTAANDTDKNLSPRGGLHPTDWSSKTEADTDTQETHSETCSASFYSEVRTSRVAPFCRRPGKAPFRWTRVGLRPLRSYRKQGVGKGSLTINKYVGRRLRLLLLRTRRGQILAAVEAGVVCLGLGQVQSAAELPAFAPTGGLSYAQLSALIPHGFRQRPGVGCSPPAITDKEARRGQGGAGSRPRDIRDRCSEVLS